MRLFSHVVASFALYLGISTMIRADQVISVAAAPSNRPFIVIWRTADNDTLADAYIDFINDQRRNSANDLAIPDLPPVRIWYEQSLSEWCPPTTPPKCLSIGVRGSKNVDFLIRSSQDFPKSEAWLAEHGLGLPPLQPSKATWPWWFNGAFAMVGLGVLIVIFAIGYCVVKWMSSFIRLLPTTIRERLEWLPH